MFRINELTSTESFSEQLTYHASNAINEEKFLTVAFLAYKLDNPAIIKNITDVDYWNALNEKTGGRIACFYIDTSKYSARKYQEAQKRKKQRNSATTLRPSGKKLQSMYPLATSRLENKPDAYIEVLLDKLGYDKYSKPKYPFIIFFKVDVNGVIANNFAVNLKVSDTDEKQAGQVLLNLIERVVKQLSAIDRNGEMDRNTIFNLVKNGADTSFLDALIRFGKFGLKLRELL